MSGSAHHPPATRRELYARITGIAAERDVCRAERLLLRALARQWPDARLENLLRQLLGRLPQAFATGAGSGA